MRTAIKLSILTAACCFAASSQVQPARRIAVDSFQDIYSSTNSQVGQKLYDRLLSRLTESGAFQVFDRQFLVKVLTEQGILPANLGAQSARPGQPMNVLPPGVFDSATAVKAGKLAKVAAIVEGTITTFTFNQNSSEDATGYYGTVTLAATARLISTETGAILVAPTQTQTVRGVLRVKPPAPVQSDCRSRGFGVAATVLCKTSQPPNPTIETTTMDQLLDDAIDKCARLLARDIADASNLVVVAEGGAVSNVNRPPAMGMPASVIGTLQGITYINRGASSGLRVGQVLQISRVMSIAVTDPATGKPLTRKTLLCTLTLSDVDDRTAAGICSGNPVTAGDIAEIRGQ